MKVTLKECLELNIFKGARILAGHSALNNRVRAVSVLEGSELDEITSFILKKDELLLSGFFDLREDINKQCELIEKMSECGQAGIVIFYSEEILKNISEEIIKKADEFNVPLIVMPSQKGGSYSDVISQVMERVLYGAHFSNRLISNTIFHLLNFEKHSNFQEAVREAAINNNFQIILLSEDFNPIFSVETRHKVTIEEAIRQGIERDVDSSRVYTMIDVDGVLTYWGPIKIDGEKNYMFIVDNEDSYSPGEITKLAEIVELAMGMWKYSPERDVKAEFIKALRRGNRTLAHSLAGEMNVKKETIESVFSISNIDKEESYKVIGNFEKEFGYKIWKMYEAEELCGVIFAKEEEKSHNEYCSLFKELDKLGGEITFNVSSINGIEGAADAFQLINETSSVIQYIFPKKKNFSKYELALASNCINISMKGGIVKKNYMELLGPFRHAGDSKGKQFLETLESFVLDSGLNTAKTAQMMGVHTNTIQYRLKRIKELLGVDIGGNTVIPGLTVSLALERIEKVVKSF